MSKKASDLFSAESQSIKELFDSSGTGFYIPAYQRPYTWGSNKEKEHIKQLFDDIFYGMQGLLESSNSYTFLGAVILVDDKNKEMITPTVKFQQPDKVLHVIDGQQRLTTILMLLVELHRYLNSNLKTIENTDFHRIVKPLVSILKNCIYVQKEISYPKMIRALEDRWSEERNRDGSQYIYSSAISSYVFNYLEGNEPVDNVKNSEFDSVNAVNKAILKIKSIIGKISQNSFADDEENVPPELSEINDNKNTYKEFLGSSEFEVIKSVYENSEDQSLEILRVYVFTRYIIEKIAITSVIANDDSYAFSIFESLNTRGEPLTAFETFKPKVIEKIGLADYKGSESAKDIDDIEENISTSKDKNTESMIIYFGLAENGKKIGKKLAEQRNYMRNTFDDLNKKTLTLNKDHEKSEFVKNLRSEFVKNLLNISELSKSISWDKKIDFETLKEFKISDDNTEDYGCLCALEFLNKVNNTLSIPLLSRFYRLSKVLKDKTYFVEAVKATASFFALWRSVRDNTDGIDNCYRFLMSSEIPGNDEKDFLARYKYIKDSNEYSGYRMVVSNIETAIVNEDVDLAKDVLTNLKQNYRYILKYGRNFASKNKKENAKFSIYDQESYVKLVMTADMYKVQAVAKYLLMIATDGNTSKEKGGIDLANKHITDDNSKMLLQSRWLEEELKEVEHIAPKKSKDSDKASWEGVYDQDTNIDMLGNLAMLPKSVNASVSNKTWNVKQQVYKLYSSDLPADHKTLSQDYGIDEAKLLEVLKRSGHIYMIKNLAEFDGDWNINTIEQRTKNLAELAWKKLGNEYLGFED